MGKNAEGEDPPANTHRGRVWASRRQQWNEEIKLELSFPLSHSPMYLGKAEYVLVCYTINLSPLSCQLYS